MLRKNTISFLFVLLLPTIAYSQVNSGLRTKAMEDALYAMDIKAPQAQAENNPLEQDPDPKDYLIENENNIFAEQKISKKWPILNNLFLSLGLELGFITGMTSYDFDHHTSELEFPMRNGMVGGNIGLQYKDLSINTELWTNFERHEVFRMKDKDWNSNGNLISYTKSKARMDAFIWDVNLQYDLFKIPVTKNVDFLLIKDSDVIKIGPIVGYRYERFDFDMFDLYYPSLNGYTNIDEKVLTYKIKYRLPYFGVSAGLADEERGILFKAMYSPNPHAEDVDNHLLRGLTFYTDYDQGGDAVLCRINAFYKLEKNCTLRLGADGTFIRIDGTSWEEQRDPAWDKDQSTDAKFWLLWGGLEYRF